MGFSHAVVLAQAAHRELLSTQTRVDKDDFISNSTSTRLDRTRCLIYIDDFVVLGTCKQAVQSLLDKHKAVLASVGLPSKPSKEVRATSDPVEILGIELYGQRCRFGLSPVKMRNLVRSTLLFCERGSCTSIELASLLGKWLWAMLLVRPSLSIFQCVFKFVSAGFARRRALWRSVVKELQLACSLVPLFWVQLDAAVADVVVATDASSSGCGVAYTHVGLDTVEPLMLVTARSARSLDAGLPSLPLCHLDSDTVCLPFPSGTVWKVAMSFRWKDASPHINCLEAAACKMGVRWLLSRPRFSYSNRVLVLLDSSVVTSALTKGRSSKFQLLVQLRAIAALLISTGTCLVARHVPSALNPADGPSRV